VNGTILGTLAAVALIAWIIGRARARPVPRVREPVDLDELEAAENEVRDLGASVGPDDDVVGDDWGPGASRRSPRD
jgi:hypothetical protein